MVWKLEEVGKRSGCDAGLPSVEERARRKVRQEDSECSAVLRKSWLCQ